MESLRKLVSLFKSLGEVALLLLGMAALMAALGFGISLFTGDSSDHDEIDVERRLGP